MWSSVCWSINILSVYILATHSCCWSKLPLGSGSGGGEHQQPLMEASLKTVITVTKWFTVALSWTPGTTEWEGIREAVTAWVTELFPLLTLESLTKMVLITSILFCVAVCFMYFLFIYFILFIYEANTAKVWAILLD